MYEIIVLDCGANDGCSILKFREILKSAGVNNYLIIAYEPLAYFEKYLNEIADDKTKINILACGDNDGLEKMYLSDRSDGSTLISTKTSNGIHKERYITVQTVDICRIINELPPHKELWLKLDVEGKEYDIIERLIAAKKLRAIKKLFVEWHQRKLRNFPIERHNKCLKSLSGIEVLSWNALKYQHNTDYEYINYINNASSEKIRVLVGCCDFANIYKAHTLHTVMMARGFRNLGYNVDLIVNKSAADFCSAYSSELADINVIAPENIVNYLLSGRYDIYYFRSFVINDDSVAEFLKRNKARVFVETHAASTNQKHMKLIEHYSSAPFVKLVTINKKLAESYGFKNYVIHPCPMIVPLSVSPMQFDNTRINILYAGSLDTTKGTDFLVNALLKYNNPRIMLHLVGGPESNIDRLRGYGMTNVIFHGYVRHADVWNYLYAADFLILPYVTYGQSDTVSPLKLMEYMYTGKPIISSNVPGIKEWVDVTNVHFFEESNDKSLIDLLGKLINIKHVTNEKNIEVAKSYSVENKCKFLLRSLG